MLVKSIISFLYFIAFTNASRVIYMIMHAEKPTRGSLDFGSKWSTTQDIPFESDNGLGKTGYERAKCLVDIFGKNAVSYRQPKAIIYQHYEKQGDFIDSGDRGLHQSRRMYETAALLAKDLGIDLDEQKCCGGDPEDMYTYIESLDPSINPILIVHQHQQIYALAKKYAKKFGKTLKYSEFKYDSSIVWTLVEGEVVENWNMGCYFDKPTTEDILVDNLDQLIVGSDLTEINASDSNLLQEETPLITTKAVPASLLTTITAKVPPNGASTMGQPNQPATVAPAEITTTFVDENGETVTSISGSRTIDIQIGDEVPTANPTEDQAPEVTNPAEANLAGDEDEDVNAAEAEDVDAAEAEAKVAEPVPEPTATTLIPTGKGETINDSKGAPAIFIPEVNEPVNVPSGTSSKNKNKNNNNNNNNDPFNIFGNNNNKANENNDNDPLNIFGNNNNNNPFNNNNNNPFNNNKDDKKKEDNNNNNNDPWNKVWNFQTNSDNKNQNKNQDKNNNENGDWWNPWNWNDDKQLDNVIQDIFNLFG